MAFDLAGKGERFSCSNAVAILVIICIVPLARNTLFSLSHVFPTLALQLSHTNSMAEEQACGASQQQ